MFVSLFYMRILKTNILFLLLLYADCVCAQKVNTFIVKKKSVRDTASVFHNDTFAQRTYVSESIEWGDGDGIAYRRGIKVLDKNFLVCFRATQSILDSYGIYEQKNSSGEWVRVPYVFKNDSLFFITNQTLPDMRRPNIPVTITKSYSAFFKNDTLDFTFNITSTSNEVPPKEVREKYFLYREDLVVTRKR